MDLDKRKHVLYFILIGNRIFETIHGCVDTFHFSCIFIGGAKRQSHDTLILTYL